MQKLMLAGLLTGVIITGEYRAFGAEMSELDGPSFAIGSDMVLSGDEPEFAKCKAFQSEYLGGISAKAEAVVYARSSLWGYVVRTLYTSKRDMQGHPEKGTLICWRTSPSDKTNFLVDVAGTAADLKKAP